jgi:outer membrane protein assembly factor BamE (lipoprotein component of BamABCDE complex)
MNRLVSLRGAALPVLTVCAALSLTACSSVSETRVRGQEVSETALDQIPIGSSQEQVMVVLGTPSTTATVNGEVYYYISQTEKRAMRFMKPEIEDRRIVAVYFDKDRRVERVANYGLEDGVVFDFVSRKTPTTGVEKTLLQQMLGLISF